MTVAAVILSASVEGAVADTLGQPRVRRLADLAWSGGALPIVVVSPDPDGAVAAALAGSEAVYGSPAPPEAGPVGQMVRGAELALAEVHDTTAVLLWPARMTWVGPETITSLIETHGMDRAAMLRPAWHGEPGWPVLLPTSAAGRAAGGPGRPHAAAGHRGPRRGRARRGSSRWAIRASSTTSTRPVADLPAYEGPPDPPAGHSHEWGADVAAEAGLTGALTHHSVVGAAPSPRINPSRTRATGTVAPAIPPMTKATPSSCVGDGFSPRARSRGPST